ncbi:MAG: DDE-type integrase/transposase/recombinase [Bryobacterales bacterium]|nr:DDE-type integrase/transposase/recombinase [Bryobacterales bacterium]
MTCHNCAASCRAHGRNRNGTRRYRCPTCRKTFSESRRTIGNMYLPIDKALLAVHLLVEGNSIRSTSRIVGIEQNTISSLLLHAGEGCAELLRNRIRAVPVSHLELDEIWTFVLKKQKRVMYGDPKTVGDAYCYIALDRGSRLVVAYHLGKRDDQNTVRFIRKVRAATAGTCQISTDAYAAYQPAIGLLLEDRASHAKIVKAVGPGRIEAGIGQPNLDETETTYVERLNGTLRQHSKRLTRKTYAFSKRWKMLDAALALFFAHYNWCWVQRTLKTTPAVAAGLASEPWTLEELLTESA